MLINRVKHAYKSLLHFDQLSGSHSGNNDANKPCEFTSANLPSELSFLTITLQGVV